MKSLKFGNGRRDAADRFVELTTSIARKEAFRAFKMVLRLLKSTGGVRMIYRDGPSDPGPYANPRFGAGRTDDQQKARECRKIQSYACNAL